MNDPMSLNGHAAPSSAAVNGSSPPTSERQQLEDELDRTTSELDHATAELRRKEAEIKAALRDELLASRERLAEMDRAHDERVAAIRSATASALERVLGERSPENGDNP